MRAALLLPLALACRTGDKVEAEGLDLDTGALDSVDEDGDGFAADEDCDDEDASVNAGAVEVCDGVDNDCDGEIDEGVTDTWYGDADGDGYGDAGAPIEACSQPAGTASAATDCDDTDAAIHPAAAERCDGVDNDCDGDIDEGVTEIWYADADGDGYGDPDAALDDCDPGEGYVADATDCDDADPAVSPSGTEVCNDADDDCDGDVDEEAVDAPTWYADADGDGYGDLDAPFTDCDPPPAHVADASDCDDGAFEIHPDAAEVCDGLDNDCDALVDDADLDLDTSTQGTWYADSDADGYGDASASVTACFQPSGAVADATDCDDAAAAVNPGAQEVCNSLDDDCDALVDDDDPSLDASTGATFYADADGDGYGDAATTTDACAQPSGTVTDATDCDDADAAVNPGATEACNGADDDCDGATSWLEDDDDGDGLLACETAVWLRTDAESNNDPTATGSSGSSEAAALVTAAGFSWSSTSLSTAGLSRSWLDDVGLLIVIGRGDDGPLSAAEAQDLDDWVDAGGSLFYTGYHPNSASCDMVDSLPTAFGLACASSSSSNYWSGSATTVTSHPVTSGVSSVVGAGGERWTVSSPASTVVSTGSSPVVVVLSHGDGRVVGVSDEWFLYNAGTGSADISQGDNEQLIENAIDWLGDFAL